MFSFAIVMSEVVTLRPPYADMLSEEGGASLPQIVEMTKPPTNVRPTVSNVVSVLQVQRTRLTVSSLFPSIVMKLPEEINEEMESLVLACWHVEPSLRPSFEVIVMRLQMMLRESSVDQQILKSQGYLASSPSIRKKSSSEEIALQKEKAILLCKQIHGAFWRSSPGLWDKGAVQGIVRPDATVTATDSVLNEILKSERGCEAIRSCGKLMYGDVEDGSEVIPDPLLTKDIVVNVLKGTALLTVRFSLSAGNEKEKETSFAAFKKNRPFGSLLEEALAEQAGAIAEDATPLRAAVEKGSKRNSRFVSSSLPRKILKKRGIRSDSYKRSKKGTLEHVFNSFVKAAHFVRYGDGIKVLHPSAKLRLFGLMMQAQNGDFSDGQECGRFEGTEKKPLELLKRKAWEGQRGKKRKECMEEYTKTLTEIAPQWKLSRLICRVDDEKEHEVAKPKRMMWVMSIQFVERARLGSRSLGKGSLKGKMLDMASLEVASIHIMQGSNASQAKLWFEEVASEYMESQKATEDKTSVHDVFDEEKDSSTSHELGESIWFERPFQSMFAVKKV